MKQVDIRLNYQGNTGLSALVRILENLVKSVPDLDIKSIQVEQH